MPVNVCFHLVSKLSIFFQRCFQLSFEILNNLNSETCCKILKSANKIFSKRYVIMGEEKVHFFQTKCTWPIFGIFLQHFLDNEALNNTTILQKYARINLLVDNLSREGSFKRRAHSAFFQVNQTPVSFHIRVKRIVEFIGDQTQTVNVHLEFETVSVFNNKIQLKMIHM